MKHLNLQLERLEQRIAPGGCGHHGGSKGGSKGGSGGSKGGSGGSGGSKSGGSKCQALSQGSPFLRPQASGR